MTVTLDSTTKLVTLVIAGAAVEARVWEGRTSTGIVCHAYIPRLTVQREADADEFDREFKQLRAPRTAAVAALPRRIVLR